MPNRPILHQNINNRAGLPMSSGKRTHVVSARRFTAVAALRRRTSALILAALLSTSALFAYGADEVLVKAKSFLDANNAQAAYNLLAPLQSQRAGDPDFDYLLGVAALDLGKNTEAVFALERVLSVRP